MCKVIGIDISKASFDVGFKRKDQKFSFFKFGNNLKGFNKFRKLIDEGDHCVMEATGPYYLFLAQYLFRQGIKVSVVNPLQIKHFVRMRMAKAKTDKKDAMMIALYGQSEQPILWQPDEKHVMQLQQNHTAIEGLQKQATMLNNQLEAFSQIPDNDKEVMRVLRALLKTIKLKIAKLESRMLEIVEEYYQETFSSLKTIPGIGPKTAIILIAITNNFKKFDDIKKLSAYVGLAPRVYESGTSIKGKGHITKMGNKYVRKLLYLCAWSAKKHNEQCKTLYERLSAKGKPERVIKIAIANKLLRQAFAIGSNLSEYDKKYEKILAF
jgi:transposase